MPKRLAGSGLPWLWLSALVVLADQASKGAAIAALVPARPLPVVPSLNLFLTYNRGISFSLLDGPGDLQRWLLAALAMAVAALLTYGMSRLPRHRGFLAAALALVIGGAVGNLIDRAAWGHVIDFIQLYYGDWSFAVFNIADAAISTGAALMLLDLLRGGGILRNLRA